MIFAIPDIPQPPPHPLRSTSRWVWRAAVLAVIGCVAWTVYSTNVHNEHVSEEHRRAYECARHMDELAMAMVFYAEDHKNHLPPAKHWVSELRPYLRNPKEFQCPSDTSGAACSYAMNAACDRLDLSKITAETHPRVVLFETTHPGDNPHGGVDAVIRDRHWLSTNPNPGIGFGIPLVKSKLKDFDRGSSIVLAGHQRSSYVTLMDDPGPLNKGQFTGKEFKDFDW